MSWLKKKKRYSRPRKPFDKVRFEEEKEIVKKYGLKKKREIWKANSEIERIRNIAKSLITRNKEEQDEFVKRLKKSGLKVEKLTDVLALKKEDWLDRRLQTIIFKKGLAKTPKQSRQLITHRHIKVNKNIVSVPSYVVEVDEEDKIEVIAKPIKPEKSSEGELIKIGEPSGAKNE